MRSFREKRAVQLFWVTINVTHLETERMTQESTTYPGNGVKAGMVGKLVVGETEGGRKKDEMCVSSKLMLLSVIYSSQGWHRYFQKVSKVAGFHLPQSFKRLSPEEKKKKKQTCPHNPVCTASTSENQERKAGLGKKNPPLSHTHGIIIPIMPSTNNKGTREGEMEEWKEFPFSTRKLECLKLWNRERDYSYSSFSPLILCTPPPPYLLVC